ncbi:MAG: aldehyde dehydrogenase family protein [Ignavibacteriaceae bacterium]|nr:aldehyde dehydrogenase family protein [Ignavibacteriaceae bacterium]
MNQERKYSISINPATGEEIGKTLVNTTEELNEAVRKAAVAQPVWAAAGFDERKRCLLKIRNYIADNADRIAEVVSLSAGKVLVDSMSTEVLNAAMAVNFYAKNGKKVLKKRRLGGGNILTLNKISRLEYVPFGVVGIISPWNYPFSIPFHEIAMALIAGNALILKVASHTLEVGRVIEECVKAGGLPENIFTLINLPGSIAGDAFIESGINKLFFTGSVPVGKQLMKKASERLLPISLELGGNDAMIVCRDADIYRAAGGALWAGLANTGQSCAGVERLYVDHHIYDEFVKELKSRAARLRFGLPDDPSAEIGSLTTEKQLKTIKEHVKDAEGKGAELTKVEPPPDFKGFYHPVVIVEKTSDNMITMKEETFGPVIAVTPFNSIEDAIRMANNSDLGLTASVWTTDIKKGKEIASRIEAGSIMINDHLMSHGLAETPWGGFKNSGYGRTHGPLGLLAMAQPRVIINDILPGVKKDMWWHPYSKEVYDGLRGAIEFLYSGNMSLKFNAMFRLVKTFLRSFRKD